MSYIDMETSFIENATMKKRLRDNSTEVMVYSIQPNEGYVLHDTQYDTFKRDEFGEDTEEILPGFIPYPADVTVAGNYDFTANPRQLYCVPADTVPENQIFNNGGNHEVASTENTETE